MNGAHIVQQMSLQLKNDAVEHKRGNEAQPQLRRERPQQVGGRAEQRAVIGHVPRQQQSAEQNATSVN